MYKVVAIISFLIRNLALPNPFSSFEMGLAINVMIEPILILWAYFVTGLFYERRTNAALGSTLFLFFYLIHAALLTVWNAFSFDIRFFASFGAVYIVMLTVASLVTGKSRTGFW